MFMLGNALTGFGIKADRSPYNRAFDLNYASYSQSATLNEESQFRGIAVNPDGTVLMAITLTGLISQYSMTDGDVSTLSFIQSYDIGSDDGLYITPDGTKLYGVDPGTDSVNSFTLPNPWSLTGIIDDSQAYYTGTYIDERDPYGFFIKDKKMWITGITQDLISQVSLDVAYDIGTELGQDIAWAASNSNPRDVYFSDDGNTLFELSDGGDTIYQYDLGTNMDLTGTVTENIAFSLGINSPYGMAFGSNGMKMYLVNDSGFVYQYNIV